MEIPQEKAIRVIYSGTVVQMGHDIREENAALLKQEGLLLLGGSGTNVRITKMYTEGWKQC